MPHPLVEHHDAEHVPRKRLRGQPRITIRDLARVHEHVAVEPLGDQELRGAVGAVVLGPRNRLLQPILVVGRSECHVVFPHCTIQCTPHGSRAHRRQAKPRQGRVALDRCLDRRRALARLDKHIRAGCETLDAADHPAPNRQVLPALEPSIGGSGKDGALLRWQRP